MLLVTWLTVSLVQARTFYPEIVLGSSFDAVDIFLKRVIDSDFSNEWDKQTRRGGNSVNCMPSQSLDAYIGFNKKDRANGQSENKCFRTLRGGGIKMRKTQS